jgi:hypothetical protein
LIACMRQLNRRGRQRGEQHVVANDGDRERRGCRQGE